MIPTLANTKIGEVNRRDPVRVGPAASLLHAVTLLREHKRGAVIVEDSAGAPVGIFTEHDLVTRVDHTDHGWHETTVAEVMTPTPVTVSADTPLAVVVRKMGRGGFRHVPISGPDGRITGVVSIRDILRHITEMFPQEFLNLPSDPEHAARNPWGG